MDLTCSMAFKEWAVICHALASGEQTLILRKGGIHEGRDGFRVAHSRFWLFPTYLHQADRNKLIPRAWETLDSLAKMDTEVIRLDLLAEVTDVIEIRDESVLPCLDGLHWWSDSTLHQRFHYRDLGLYLLIVRVSISAVPLEVPNSSRFAGCRTWVEFDRALTMVEPEFVLTDEQFQAQRVSILNRIGEPHSKGGAGS